MGWFSGNSVNENTSVQEGYHKAWKFVYSRDTPVSLSVQRTDGYGPNVYLMSEGEYHNYNMGLLFHYITQLSYENIERFDNSATLSRGTYFLVALLPKIADGGESYSYFSIRFEEIK